MNLSHRYLFLGLIFRTQVKNEPQALSTSLEFFQLGLKSKNEVVMGGEYQGWVGQGRELFQGEERNEEGEVEAEEVRESYNVRNISDSGKFPDQTCPELRSAKAGARFKNLLKIHQFDFFFG